MLVYLICPWAMSISDYTSQENSEWTLMSKYNFQYITIYHSFCGGNEIQNLFVNKMTAFYES